MCSFFYAPHDKVKPGFVMNFCVGERMRQENGAKGRNRCAAFGDSITNRAEAMLLVIREDLFICGGGGLFNSAVAGGSSQHSL